MGKVRSSNRQKPQAHANDTPLVITELQELRNVHYNDRPVSVYGGMVDLPLVVTRPDQVSYFDDDDRERLTDGKLWAEFDAEAGTGLGATERDLRENRFGDQLWLALDAGARTFIAPVSASIGSIVPTRSSRAKRRICLSPAG